MRSLKIESAITIVHLIVLLVVAKIISNGWKPESLSTLIGLDGL